MLELDGSAGGGQLVRTALAVSALSGEPFRMTGIRDARPDPGLRPQHLAAVRALAAITGADVSGAVEGSGSLRFEPGPVRPGRYEVDVGTAGSVPLLFDTLLPLTMELDSHLGVLATGGTDVKWAPTMDYLRLVKLPLLRRHGIGAAVDLSRRGFYPAGGGEAMLSLFPSSIEPLEIDTAPSSVSAWVSSVASEDLADAEVAERQASAAIDELAELDVGFVRRAVEYTDSRSPGSAVTIGVDFGSTLVGGDALGERGVPAEEVASRAVERALEPLETGAAVDRHMADQLLVFLASAGGRVTIPTETDHVETSLRLLEAFGYDVQLETDGPLSIVRS